MKKRFKQVWHKLSSPSKMALGTLLIIGFGVGIIFWIGFNYGLNQTNTEQFCISCHSNDVWQEYIHTAHYQNRSGVKATCPDCHVPHEFAPKIWRKLIAAKEVFAYYMGYTDTLDKFNARRLEMAEREWERMKKNHSQECKNCHQFDTMDFSQQRRVAVTMHANALKTQKSCIDCHKGIAHELPNMKTVEPRFNSDNQ